MDEQLIDRLAQEIRRVDGSNSLGAAALAEALMPFLAATALQSSGGEVVAGKWRQLTTADEVKAALDAEQAVEWTSDATDSIDMPGNREPDSGGWVPHTKNHYTEDRLFKIGKFRAFITASPAQPSGFGEVCVVCDWKDADPFPRFIEAEVGGRSVRFDWRDRADGLKELVIPTQGETK